LPPLAVKTGMLYSEQIIETVVDTFRKSRRPPLVVDPVMASTSGSSLLEPAAAAALSQKLLPLAMLVTPNLLEAQFLLGVEIKSLQDSRQAARQLVEKFGCAVLVKGGHLPRAKEAVDVFYDGHEEV